MMTRNWRCFSYRYNKHQPSNPKFHLNSTQHIQKANLTRRGWVVDVGDRCCWFSVVGEEAGRSGEESECFTSVKSTIPTKILFISLLLRLLFKPVFSHTGCSSSETVSPGRSVFLISKYTEARRHGSRETGFVCYSDRNDCEDTWPVIKVCIVFCGVVVRNWLHGRVSGRPKAWLKGEREIVFRISLNLYPANSEFLGNFAMNLCLKKWYICTVSVGLY
jgi:hypothetical protein